MAVRSKRLAGPTTVAAAAAVLIYTAGAGETVLIKRVTVVPWTVNTSLVLAIGATTVLALRVWDRPVTFGDSLDAETWLVLQPGEQLRALAGAGTLTVALHGAELEGVADQLVGRLAVVDSWADLREALPIQPRSTVPRRFKFRSGHCRVWRQWNRGTTLTLAELLEVGGRCELVECRLCLLRSAQEP